MKSLFPRTHNRRARCFALGYLCRVIQRINEAGLDEHSAWAVHLICANPMYMVREGLQPEDVERQRFAACQEAA